MTMPALYISDFSDNSAAGRFAWLFFLVNSEAFFFQFMEIFELSLPFSDNKEFFRVAVNGKWILSILLEIYVFVFSKA